MTDNIYTKEQLLVAEKALRLVYDGLNEEGLLNGEIKKIFHEHMNKITDLLRYKKDNP